MIYYLFDYLNDLNVPGAGLFNYISFRAAMALLTSLIVSVFIGKRVIDLLRKQQIGETVRDLGLDGQIEKTGTPTMGGLIILGAILIPTLLFARLDNIYVITMLISTVWLGLIGFADDYIKVFKKNKHVNLINVSDIDLKKKNYSKILNTKFIENENEIFENKKINIVSIATYDNFHYTQIIKGIK